jgi:hypothetical protein
MKKWRWSGLPPDDWGQNGNLTVAYVMECLQMFGGLNMGKFQWMTPFVNSNLTVEHCLQANNVVYKTICDILQKEDVENGSGFARKSAMSLPKLVNGCCKPLFPRWMLHSMVAKPFANFHKLFKSYCEVCMNFYRVKGRLHCLAHGHSNRCTCAQSLVHNMMKHDHTSMIWHYGGCWNKKTLGWRVLVWL